MKISICMDFSFNFLLVLQCYHSDRKMSCTVLNPGHHLCPNPEKRVIMGLTWILSRPIDFNESVYMFEGRSVHRCFVDWNE